MSWDALRGRTNLIRDNPLRLLVIQRRNGKSSLVLRIDGEVDIAEMFEAVDGVLG